MEGILLCGVGGFYTALSGDVRYVLRAQAKLRRRHETPMVGDRIVFQPGEGTQAGWLTAIEPRRNHLVRPPVANIDQILVVVSASYPQPDLFLVDQMLICARLQGMEASLVVNKSDEDEENARAICRQYRGAGVRVYTVCARTGAGLSALAEDVSGRVIALGGQSGVGKSTLINRLYGLRQETGVLSERIERGKHTTRHCELIPVEGGGMVLDTPGFSLLALERMDPTLLRTYVPEFDAYEGQCQYHLCTHVHEPGCAAIQAVQAGELDAARWKRYQALFEEMKQRWSERYD